MLEVGERTGRSLKRIAGDGKVVLENGSLVARALLDEHGERPFHLVEAVRIAEVGTGVAASADRLGRLRQAKACGQRARTVGGGDRLLV